MPQPPRPLAASDDRNAFDCGRDSLNNWFRRHARLNHVSGSSRVNVIADSNADRVSGFVALCASQIGRGYLPKAQQRNQPDPIPVVLLGQLAVDKDFQSRGYATSLILFALRSALRASEEIGCVGVVTHPLDDVVHGFYKRWGFEDLPFDPKRAMIVRMSELRRIIGD